MSSVRSSGAAAPRVVLLWACILIAVALGLYAVAPWILPVRIREGPMVQLVTEHGALVVWYTTRPVACAFTLVADGKDSSHPVTARGVRNEVRLADLNPGSSYEYQILAGRRSLTARLTLKTNPPAGRRYTFGVLGDCGMANRAQFALAAEMAKVDPPLDFILLTGDVVYGDETRAAYTDRFFAPYRHLLPRINFWPCLGNHDLGEGGRADGYREVFEVPANGPAQLPAEHNYWFDFASCRIAVVDSNLDESALRTRVAPWLLGVLSDCPPQIRWRFVAFHHPPYTAGKYAPDVRIQRALVPAIEAAGVDIVFNGHDHNYQRTHPLRDGQVVEGGAGVVYVVTGAGGAELYSVKVPAQRPAHIAFADDQHHSFTQITIDGDELHGRQIACGGEVLDEFRIVKPSTP